VALDDKAPCPARARTRPAAAGRLRRLGEPGRHRLRRDGNSAFEVPDQSATRYIYDQLVTFPYGDLTNVQPALAKSWDISPDGRTWTFHLRTDAHFASGNPVTSADVVYSIKRFLNLKVEPALSLLTQTGLSKDNVDQDVVAVDPATVRITLPKPFSPGAFLAVLTNTTLSIVDSKVVQAHAVDGDWGHAWLDSHSAGSGPYQLADFTRNVQVELTPNPHYTEGPVPALKRIVFSNVNEGTGELDMLQRGNADVAMDLSPEQLASLQGNGKFSVFKGPEITLTYLAMNVKNVPAFASPDVREAVKYAIDYNSIVQNLLQGDGTVWQGIIPQGIFGATKDLPFTYDPAKAKQLLAQGGYGDGFAFDLTIPGSTSPGGVDASQLGEAIAADLAKIGVTAHLRQLASSEALSEFRAQKLQAGLFGWAMDYADPSDFADAFADYTAHYVAYRESYDNPQLDQLSAQAASLPNGPQRAALYAQLNRLDESGPTAILYQPEQLVAYASGLKGLSYDGANYLDLPRLSK
jgi:peptide/nickel transport system substrate-binding protein